MSRMIALICLSAASSRMVIARRRAEKAVVDAVLEKAGQLSFQAKEAEALIAALREERDVAGRVLEAVREAREEKKVG